MNDIINTDLLKEQLIGKSMNVYLSEYTIGEEAEKRTDETITFHSAKIDGYSQRVVIKKVADVRNIDPYTHRADLIFSDDTELAVALPTRLEFVP